MLISLSLLTDFTLFRGPFELLCRSFESFDVDET
jgi:hypothetical protein